MHRKVISLIKCAAPDVVNKAKAVMGWGAIIFIMSRLIVDEYILDHAGRYTYTHNRT